MRDRNVWSCALLRGWCGSDAHGAPGAIGRQREAVMMGNITATVAIILPDGNGQSALPARLADGADLLWTFGRHAHPGLVRKEAIVAANVDTLDDR